MGSKGRLPPPHIMRRPLPGPSVGHHDLFGPGMLPPPGGLPPMDMLPPPEIMEQKLAAQHMEMERLATENRRLAATHGTLRQQLAAAQQELQMLESQIGGAKSEREQKMRGLVERISKMEAELPAAENIKVELQQTRNEALSLAELRQELFAKVQYMNADLQRANVDVQQIPALLSELDHLRKEFQQYRATYEHERKVYLDHLESLQVMDKEYRTMAEEVAKLRAELNNTANADRRAVYGGATGYGENDASAGHNPSGRGTYEDGYGAPQVHASYPTSAAAATTPVAAGGGVAASSGGTPSYGAPQPGSTTTRPGYDASRIPPGHEIHRGGPGYDPSRAPAYDPQGGQGPAYNAQRLPNYDPYNKGVNYDMQRPAPYDPQRSSSGYDMARAANYDMASRGVAPPPVQPPLNMAHGAAAPTGARAGVGAGGPEMQARGGNAARR